MPDEIVLDARVRDARGRRAVRKLRTHGLLPGVVYGTGIEPRTLTVLKLDLVRALHQAGAHPLVTLRLGSDEYLAIVKEVQVDAVRNSAIHVDFLRVQENVTVATEVEVLLVGEPLGVKIGGGILESHMRSVQIEALPRTIPEHLSYDVSSMEIGDVARVGDIAAPEGVTILTDPEETLATVAAPRLEVEARPTEAEAAEAGEAAAEGEAAAPEREETSEES